MVLTIKESIVRLENFKLITQHKILGSAFYAAAKPIEDAQKSIVKSKITERTGNLVKSIGRVRVPLKKAKEIGAVRVGPRRGGIYKGYHGHLIEFGTKERHHKSGKSTGRGPSLPFVAPAASRLPEATAIVGRKLDLIVKRWAKSGKIIEA